MFMNNPYSIFRRVFKPDPGQAFRSRNARCLFRVALTAILFGSLPGHSLADDLWDIYSLALTNDPVYQAATLSHSANALELPIARTAFKPSVTAEGSVREDQTDEKNTNSGNNDDYILGINFNLPLYNRVDRARIDQSRRRVEISKLEVLQAKQDLILRVANQYFNVLAARDAREVARLEKIAIKRQMDLASERLEVGLVTRTDLFDAKARFKQAEANQIQAQNNINNDLALLKQIIGVTPEQLLPLSESAPLELPRPNDVESWVNRSLSNNIMLAIRSVELEIAQGDIEQQKSALFPVVSLDGGHSWKDSRGDSNTSPGGSNTTRIAVNVRIPVYARGVLDLKARQAGLLYNLGEKRLEQTRRSVSAQATTVFLTMTSRVSQVEALFDAITAGESALEAKEEGFNAGLTTNLDVLDAQRDLSRSRTDYLRARYDYIISVLELERAVGDLDEDDIKRVNGWL